MCISNHHVLLITLHRFAGKAHKLLQWWSESGHGDHDFCSGNDTDNGSDDMIGKGAGHNSNKVMEER